MRGNTGRRVHTVGTLTGAAGGSISFLANPSYRRHLATTRAGAVILEERFAAECPAPALIAANPYAVYARVARFLHPPRAAEPGIHPSASVDNDAVVAGSAQVCAQAAVARGAVLGESVVIGEGSVVGPGAAVGDGTRLAPRVVLMDGVRIGKRCLLHSGAVVGGDGFGFAREDPEWVKVPQLGGVTIGDDVEIGANTTVDRGAVEDTVIEDGVKMDNQVQIAHNVRIGAHTVMSAFSGVAGSTRVGARCLFGGAVVVVGHLTICDDAVFTFRTAVLRSVTEPGTYSGTLGAEEAGLWRRNAARFRALDETVRQLRAGTKPGRRTGDD